MISDQCFTEPITPSHWARFRHYSSRIRVIQQKGFLDNVPPIKKKCFEELLLTLPAGEVFLPALRSLKWVEREPLEECIILPLMHKGLTALHLNVRPWDLCGLMSHMGVYSPQLETLQLWASATFRSEEEKLLCRAVAPHPFESLTALRSLGICQNLLTPELLHDLSIKPHLHQLMLIPYLFHTTRSTSLFQMDTPSPTSFTKLSQLSVGGGVLMTMANTVVQAPHLTSLIVRFDDLDYSMGRVVDLLSASCARLTALSLIFRMCSDFGPHSSLTMAEIMPLLSLRALSTFTIDHPFPPNLNDDDMEHIAMSFPDIQHFGLCVRAYEEQPREVPTLACLVPFARCCRRLVSFGVYLDASVPVAFNKDQHILFSPTLETMEVFCSAIEDPNAVVRFLSFILPPATTLQQLIHNSQFEFMDEDVSYRFDNVDDISEESEKYMERWQEVISSLADLRSKLV